jgi:hypothetical protein
VAILDSAISVVKQTKMKAVASSSGSGGSSSIKHDGVTISIIKKKGQQARGFFEGYKSLQKLVQEDKALVQTTNNGPLITVQVTGPRQVRDSVNVVKEWGRKQGIDCAIFSGKSTLTQILELPIRSSFAAVVNYMGGDNRAAREKGLETNWMDHDRKWSISLNGDMLIRGKADLNNLEAEVHINLYRFAYLEALEIEQAMKSFDKADRFGSLLEISYSRAESFTGDIWGRRRRS